MTELDLIIDLHLRQDRQGPGGDEETMRALGLTRLSTSEPLELADIGCGTGASSLILARALNAKITAIDAAAPFVERVRQRTDAAGLAGRIDAVTGQMESLAFEDARFDLIWSEGAIYNMGFAEGLRAWKRLLRPGGVIAVSELTWTTLERPAAVHHHWSTAYPGIDTAAGKLREVERAGYAPLGMFFLPRACWVEHYYGPLRAAFPAFLDRHGHSEQARQIVEAEHAEIELYRDHGAWYGYAFYIARKPGEPA